MAIHAENRQHLCRITASIFFPPTQYNDALHCLAFELVTASGVSSDAATLTGIGLTKMIFFKGFPNMYFITPLNPLSCAYILAIFSEVLWGRNRYCDAIRNR